MQSTSNRLLPTVYCILLLVLLSFIFTALSLTSPIRFTTRVVAHSSLLRPPPLPIETRSQDSIESLPDLCVLSVGDVLILSRYEKQAEKFDGFSHIYQHVTPMIKAADIATANFEGVSSTINDVGPKKWSSPYTFNKDAGFNYPVNLASALADVGFKVLSVANNHCMDRGVSGLQQTLDTLESVGMIASGGRKIGSDPHDLKGFVHVVETKGWKVGWLSCTTFTNGLMYKRYKTTKEEVHRFALDCDNSIEMIRTLVDQGEVDVIIVKAHQGPEWNPKHTIGRCPKSI